MDFVGEIVEHEVAAPVAPSAPIGVSNGFPELGKLKRKSESRWKKGTARGVGRQKPSKSTPPKELEEPSGPESEAERIHKENLQRMAQMTEEEITREQQELLNQLDPKLIEALLKRTEKKHSQQHNHTDSCNHEGKHGHAEGYGGWIGAMKTPNGTTDLSQMEAEEVEKVLGGLSIEDEKKISETGIKSGERKSSLTSFESRSSTRSNEPKKSVTFNTVATISYEDLDDKDALDPDGWEDVDDLNDMIPGADQVAPHDYQLVEEEDENRMGVHFVKPKQDQDLDLNDPDFYDKLHEKYYPDLPKETSKLSWMTEPLPKQVSTTYESLADMRFDFKGDLIELDSDKTKQKEIPTYVGLHHHSDNPHLAGYTLPELAHLSRSVVPGQRCLSIQMLGRILHKLGLHKYNILPIDESAADDEPFNQNIKEWTREFEKMMWDLISQLRIIDTITEAADESKTRNMSVRNYAIEALWLWKKGGGQVEETEEEMVRKVQSTQV